MRRFSWRKARIGDVIAELNAFPPMPVFVTFVHAHVNTDWVLDTLRWDAAFTLACCMPASQLTQTRTPHSVGDDMNVLSPERHYQVLVNPKRDEREPSQSRLSDLTGR